MRVSRLIAAAMAAAMLSVPTTFAQGDDEQLVVGALQFLKNFHPLIQVNNTKRNLIALSLRPITAFDPEGNNTCVLCEEIPTLENGLAKIVDKADGS